MADWMSLLPQAPKQQSASDVYQDAVRGQVLQQTKQQNAQYNQARIAETNALAAQHQRVTDVKNGMAKAYADNLKVNPDGTASVNHVGVLKSMADQGFADETPDILKEAAAQRKADLENLQNKAKHVGDKLGGITRLSDDEFGDPHKVAQARNQTLSMIDELVANNVLSAQDAAPARAAASNYNKDFQDGWLNAHSQQAESLHRQFSNAKEAVGLHVDQMTADPKIRKAVAEASGAETKATEEQAGLLGRQVGAGAYPQSNVGQLNAYTAPPIGGMPTTPATPTVAPTSTTPQQPADFETKLTPAEETNFQNWKAKYAPNDSGADYDLRGAFKAGLTPDPASGHWPDTFKKPNHPTFSNESQYAKDMPGKAGHWEGDKFIPPGTKPKDPDWTQEKQDRWDALRSDPALSRIAGKLAPTWSKAAEITAKQLGMTREQQVQAEARANKPAAEDKELKVIGTKLGAAAEQGPAAYTRAYDALTPEQQKLAPNPNQWDKEKTPRLARLMGMTAAEQDKATKPPKSGMSESQERMWVDRHDKLQTDEQNTWKSVGEIGDILNTPDGDDYRDPKTGKTVSMDKVQRAHWQKEYEGARVHAAELQKQAKQIRGRLKIGEFESGGGGGEHAVTPPVGGRVKVALPGGRSIVFPNQKAADDFKAAAKLK